jgi:hypothetical protein
MLSPEVSLSNQACVARAGTEGEKGKQVRKEKGEEEKTKTKARR